MDWTVGRWRVRLLGPEADLSAAFALRARVFRDGQPDRDAHDATARHLLVEDGASLQGYARIWTHSADEITQGYSAQFYDLAPLSARHPRAMELGRVCFDSEDHELPRILLGALADLMDRTGSSLLYGCASFTPDEQKSLGHLSPHCARFGPGRLAPDIVEIPAQGTGPLPRLLRLYLGFGAEVSDHAVRDADLGTVHVLAMLPLASIPPARARLLRALAPQPSQG